MTVRQPDTFPETDASADALRSLPEKYLDIEALTCRFVDEVISGKREYDERFVVIAKSNHHRARYVHDGQVLWRDTFAHQCFDVTDEVRARVADRRPMTGPHPHNWPETWREDGKCIVKSCGVWRTV